MNKKKMINQVDLFEEFESTSVISSNIEEIGQSKLNPEVIRIKFKGGATYEYTGIPEEIYEDLLDAESKGKFINRHIKTYPYTKL